jgi:lipopolysaccharide transport system ATP-binding protein
VGDAEFQKKCLGKMKDVSVNDGRTVLFVSHQMEAISRLCDKVIVFQKGTVAYEGNTSTGISYYYGKGTNRAMLKWELSKRPGNEIVKLNEVSICDEDHICKDIIDIRFSFFINIEYEVLIDGAKFTHGLNLYNSEGIHIFSSHDLSTAQNIEYLKAGHYKATVKIPGNLLAEGDFNVSVAIMRYNPFEIYLHEKDVLSFSVIDNMLGGSSRGNYGGVFPGIVRPLLDWKLNIL